MEVKELEKRHKYAAKFQPTWEFLIAAYEGTDALLEWGALTQNERESTKNHSTRKLEAYGFDYSQAVVDLFNFYLFEKDPQRQLGELSNDKQWAMFMDDCDLFDTDFDTWLIEQQRYAGAYGHMGILIDKPRSSLESVASEIQNGIYPYVVSYSPLNILDWSYERDQNGRPVLNFLKLLDDDGRYRLWYPDRWEVWEVSEKATKGAEREATLVESGTNPLEEIPFVWLLNVRGRYRNIGISDIKTVARIDASILRNLSHGEEIIKYAAFPMLRKPMKKVGAEKQGEDLVGIQAVLEFDPNKPDSKADWLEAKVKEPIDAILEWISKKVIEIYRAVNAGGIHATEISKQAKSGAALKEEFQLLNAKLVAKATTLEEAERKIVYHWLKWQKKEGLYDKLTIERPRDFSVKDLATDLENALAAKTLVASEKFQKAMMKSVVRLVMPTIPPDQAKEIDDEIDAARLPAVQDLSKILPEEG